MRFGISRPESAFRPAIEFVPDDFHKRLETSPNAVCMHWDQALPDPTYNEREGKPKEGQEVWKRVRMPGEYWGIVEGEKVLRRLFQPGSWLSGDIALTFNPEAWPLTEHDTVSACSQIAPAPVGAPPLSIQEMLTPQARTFTDKHTVVRGSQKRDGVGLCDIVGTVVTVCVPENLSGNLSGSLSEDGSAETVADFTQFFRAGDVFYSNANWSARVREVLNQRRLVLDAPAPSPIYEMGFARGREAVQVPPAVAALSVVSETGALYTPGLDVEIAQDQETLLWKTINSPPPDTRLGVVYRFLPRYVITDMGAQGAVVRGRPCLTTVIAKLWRPSRLTQ